jgi:hypothetical protein
MLSHDDAKKNKLKEVNCMGAANDAEKKFWETYQPSPLIQKIRVQTDVSGAYTWTFPIQFQSVPVIEVTVEDSADASWNHRITSLTNSAVSVQLGKQTATSLLGVNLLQIASNPQAYIHITAVQA